MRGRVIAVFHVRHVDVDNAIEQSERFEAVVSASVVYKRKPQSALRSLSLRRAVPEIVGGKI